MGSIPLPALDVKPPQPTDALGSFQKLMALRTMQQQQQSSQQEIQLRQQQIQDQQATTAAMKGWDGKDYDALSKSVLDNGGSANAAAAIQQHGLTIKKTVSDIAAQDATTGSKNLETFIKKHEAIGDQLKGLEGLPDEQIHQGTIQFLGQAAQSGILPQDQAQSLVQKVQQIQDPAALRTQLDIFAKTSMGAKAAAEQAKTEAETAKSKAQGEEATASAANKRQESQFYANSGVGAPGVPAEMSEMVSALRQNPGLTPATYPAWKAKQTSEAEAPVRIATAQAEGVARANIEAQVARGSNGAVAQVPPHLVAPAIADATKAGTEYAQSKSVSDRLAEVVADARKGNKVAYQILPQEGALQLTTSQGVHRINMAEIQNYGGGSLWDSIKGKAGKVLSGESIPSNILDDMVKMQDLMAKGSEEKYQNTLSTINQTYGAKFAPVKMQNAVQSTTPETKPPVKPEGATHTGIGSLDHKKHYLDANGKDLGPAE